MTKKYLFLDFDGVLHSTKDNSQFFERLKLLLPLIDKYAFNIVISSSWRFQFNLQDIKNFFPIVLHDKIIGMTGQALMGRHARYNEIKNYLKEHDKSLEDWRALDDTSFEFPENCENLILCSPNTGIQAKQINELEAWLKN
jgi:hypothetical protein